MHSCREVCVLNEHALEVIFVCACVNVCQCRFRCVGVCEGKICVWVCMMCACVCVCVCVCGIVSVS